MPNKTKKSWIKLLAVFAVAVFFVFIPTLSTSSPTTKQALAADTTSSVPKGCENFKGDELANCQACKADNPPPACACHPEYNFGRALTKEQFDSCIACNRPGLSSNDKQAVQSAEKGCLQNNVIVKDLNVIVNILTGVVTLVVIGVLIAGGIQYSLAGNPQAATAARKRITNGLLALFGFLFIWAFLQWLIPGGI